MSYSLDSIFHTKTMVKILKDQGHLRYAEKICQEVLNKNRSDQETEELLKSIQALLNQNRNPFISNSNQEKTVSSSPVSEEKKDFEEEELTV